MKRFISGSTTQQLMTLMSGNLDYIRSVRQAYTNPQGFDFHCTSRHKIPDSTLDQAMVALWCFEKQFFAQDPHRTAVLQQNTSPGEAEFLPSKMLNARNKGQSQIKGDYLHEKLFNLFPSAFHKSH